jgi:hypothetical protein
MDSAKGSDNAFDNLESDAYFAVLRGGSPLEDPGSVARRIRIGPIDQVLSRISCGSGRMLSNDHDTDHPELLRA